MGTHTQHNTTHSRICSHVCQHAEELERKIKAGQLQQRMPSSGGLVRDIANLVPAVQQALSLRPACRLHPGLGDESASVGLGVRDVHLPDTFLDGFDSKQLHVYRRVLGLIYI
jgi:hypothetical protein